MMLCNLLVLLSTKVLNRKQIIEQTGMAQTTWCRWYKMLTRPGKKLIYIADWRYSSNGKLPVAYYSAGFNREDELRPRKVTKSEANKHWKMRKTGELEKLRIANERTKQARKVSNSG